MKSFFSLLLIVLFATAAQAQKTPKWVAEKGYWVLESNIKTPKSTTVYFYNDEGTMIYKEKVEGIRLNISRRKTQKELNLVLTQSLAAWEREMVAKENQHLLASRLR